MTSRYPHEHGVRNLLLPLEPESETLAEVLWKAGYRTGAVQTHPRLVASSGLSQGFDDYDDEFRSHPTAEQASAEAAEWIRRAARGRRPWFLWLHLMDPHWTYLPPTEWRSRFGPSDPRPLGLYDRIAQRKETFGRVVFKNQMAPDEVAAFVNLYDAEIRYTDQSIGELLAVLDTLGEREDTVIAVTADHGESLGEHDYFFEHGAFGTEPEIHVPLILVAPWRLPSATRVPGTVQSLDIAPTLLDLLGIDRSDAFRGETLVPMAEGRIDGDRACFGESGKRFHDDNDRREVDGVAGKWRWVRQGPFKLVYVPRRGIPPDYRLFDLNSVPLEQVDVAGQNPQVTAEMKAQLDAWLAEDSGLEREYHISDETRDQLRSLGYID
jgi:arylsulfatase A-like enzyme